jgi:integrase
VVKRGRFWTIRYYDHRGRRKVESSRSAFREDAERLLRKRLQAKDDGLPIEPRRERVRFDDAARDLITDYTINGRRSRDELERRITKHLSPFFGGMRLSAITGADVRAYIAERQAVQTVTRRAYVVKRKDGTAITIPASTREITGISNAEINRELATLKRIYGLAIESGAIVHRPHIPLLRESAPRAGFFEREALHSVLAHLPAALRPVIEFAYITGWRIASEVLPLTWRQVDFAAGEVRLDAGTTKNGDGRVFPMTDDLRRLLERQRDEHERLKKQKHLCPSVFVRLVADARGGEKKPRPIKAFTKAWKNACKDAGCPGRIPHDLRRTAVRNMVRRGVPERVAMKLTGHKTASVFARYDIVSDGDLHTAAVQLAGVLASPADAAAGRGR